MPPRCSRLHTQPPSNPPAWETSQVRRLGPVEDLGGALPLGLLLLVCRSLLALSVGQQPDLFRTDHGSTQLAQHLTGNSIGPRRTGEDGSLAVSACSRLLLPVSKQVPGRTPTKPTLRASQASSSDLHTPEGGSNYPTHAAFYTSLFSPTAWATGCLLFPLAHRLLQRLAHGELPGFLDVVFHLF